MMMMNLNTHAFLAKTPGIFYKGKECPFTQKITLNQRIVKKNRFATFSALICVSEQIAGQNFLFFLLPLLEDKKLMKHFVKMKFYSRKKKEFLHQTLLQRIKYSQHSLRQHFKTKLSRRVKNKLESTEQNFQIGMVCSDC